MRILLASMPWSIFNRPSIQLGVLKSYLNRHLPEIPVKATHPYLEIGKIIGPDTYQLISESNWAGEALYSGLLFPERRDQAQKVFSRSLKGKGPRFSHPSTFESLLEQLDGHMKIWLESRELSDCTLLGLTVCFSQLLSSLYAAAAIKQRHPHIIIVLGGSTCTPSLSDSILRTFSSIDFIITGEGERAMERLCGHLLTGAPLPETIHTRNRAGSEPSSPSIDETASDREIRDLDTLPVPDYGDYFLELKENHFTFIPTLPIEFSRGCWWNKCTFCNLNLQWHGYRHKSANNMLQEFNVLKNCHHCLDFAFTDNALPVAAATSFFQTLNDAGEDSHFFAEVRHLNRFKTYQDFRRGGLKTIQVGIEALSDSLLQRMNKGVRAIDNIAAMKYAMAADIRLRGNIILEFPTSTRKEVQETLEVLDYLLPFHPLECASFFLGQGSPVFCNPKQYGIRSTQPHPVNKALFPPEYLSGLDLLIHSYRGDRGFQKKIWRPAKQKIAEWHEFHNQRNDRSLPPLSYRMADDFLIIRQEDRNGRIFHHRLKGLSREVYLACEQVVSKKELLHRFNSIKEYQISAFLKDLQDKKLLYCDKEQVLGLAFRQSP